MVLSEQLLLSRFLQAIDERWWLRHGLFWLVRMALLLWLFLYDLRTTPTWPLALRDILILLPLHLIITYSLLYGILPQLWLTNRPGRFLALLTGWFGLGLAFTFAYRHFIYIPSHQVVSSFPDYSTVYATGAHMPALLTAGVAACLRVYRQWRRQALDNAQLSQENYQAELQLLRAQIHPHFLFNTLNNLYALTLRQSDQAPVVVARLAALLRFVLKQGRRPLVALPDEVELLRNYLALQQLRYGARLTLEFQATNMPATGQIAPLLLLPLVENAFKHGSAEQLGQAHISIALAMHDSWLSCLITNTRNSDSAPPGPDGIGLRNVRQRLQLLYPQRHHFSVEPRPGTYTVRLRIALWQPLLPQVATAAPPVAVAQPAPRQPTKQPAHARPLAHIEHS